MRSLQDIEELAPSWVRQAGPDSDVVVSTRCRIARNIQDCPFPWRASERQLRESKHAFFDALDRAGPPLSLGRRLEATELDSRARQQLIHWRMVSRHWAQAGPHRWLAAAPSGDGAVMLNEEDHLRVQAILPGLQVESSITVAGDVERALGASIPFARSDAYGFLTASLSNAGTGCRVGALLHLPALARAGDLERTLAAARDTGCAIRGAFGEGTRGTGDLFQVSNTYSFGTTTARIGGRVLGAARFLVQAERAARQRLFGESAGRRALGARTAQALDQIFSLEVAPGEELSVAAVLRLAAAEGLLRADLAAANEWIEIAGGSELEGAAPAGEWSGGARRLEAQRRSEELRRRLREAARNGTLLADRAD